MTGVTVALDDPCFSLKRLTHPIQPFFGGWGDRKAHRGEGALARFSCCINRNIVAWIGQDAMKWPSWSHRKHLHQRGGERTPGAGAIYLPAAGSAGSAEATTGCTTHTALSLIAAADSLSYLRTAHSLSCSTDTKLSMLGRDSPSVGARCAIQQR